MSRTPLGPEEFTAATMCAVPWINWAAPPRRYEASAHDLPDARKAVYVAVDWLGYVAYVGSVSRRCGGVAQRFTEHLRLRHEARYWTHLWVLELCEDTPESQVRWLEGAIGRNLHPTDNHRLPTLQ